MILAIVVLSLLVVGSASAQDYPPNTLTVDGAGQAFGSPDVANVQLGVQTSGADVVEAYSAANTAMDSVIAALIEMGIAEQDLQTTGLFLYQDNPFNPETGAPSETPIYRVQNSLNITVRDISQVSTVISAGIEAGANNINNLTFGISDPAELEQEARVAAVADARQRAEQLADLLGVELGTATIITETQDAGTPILFDRMQSGGGIGGAAVQEGQLSVGVQVRITFNIQ
jgi:uncharacterized protein YggE